MRKTTAKSLFAQMILPEEGLASNAFWLRMTNKCVVGVEHHLLWNGILLNSIPNLRVAFDQVLEARRQANTRHSLY